jgi:hypothetical protein
VILVANSVLPVCYKYQDISFLGFSATKLLKNLPLCLETIAQVLSSIVFSFRRPMVLYQSPDYAFWSLRGIRHQYQQSCYTYNGSSLRF